MWLALVLVATGAMAVGPYTDYLAATARVEELTAQRDALTAAVDDLEAARQDLSDPANLELLARGELGLVRPGEIPYVVTEDPVEDAAPSAPPPAPPPVWYRQLWERLQALLP